MVRYAYRLLVGRSDGVLEAPIRGSVKSNGPSRQQLERRFDEHGVASFMRLVEHGEVKDYEWRCKLGGLLAQELIAGSVDGELMDSLNDHWVWLK